MNYNSVRPMLFGNSESEYRISMRGTVMLARYKGRYFAFSAKHNVRDFHPNQYRILLHLGGGDSFEYAQPFTFDFKYEDIKDFVVIPLLGKSGEIANFDESQVADLKALSADIWATINLVHVVGCPSQKGDVDYEEAKFNYQPVEFVGELVKPPDKNGMGTIEANIDEKELQSFNGLSGGLVYSDNRILGMVIRGSHNTSFSKSLYFIDAEYLLKALVFAEQKGDI